MRKKDEHGRWIRQPVEERFWEYVDKSAGPDGCWIWTGNISNAGYGRFTDYWQKFSAHRLSYEFANGPTPPGKNVCHTCDVRACVNPAHLWLGSHTDNMQDAIAKGRHGGFKTRGRPGARGEANGHAILTDEQVLAIRAAYQPRPTDLQGPWPKTGRPTVTSLADEYGVSRSLIHAILMRKVWTHI